MGETELNDKDKLEQMNAMLESDPGLFLSKWGRYLSQSILSLFQCLQDDYEVKFYLSSLLYKETELPTTNTRNQKSALYTLFQNRRFEYLKRELRHSDYFSDESMQLREPELYQQYVGRYIPEEKKNEPFGKNITLVNRILSNIDQSYVNDCLNRQRVVEEEQFEEEEEESDDDGPLSMDKDVEMKDSNQEKIEAKSETNESDTEKEDVEDMDKYKEEKRDELIRLLEEKFLAGKDNDFDYSQIDYNEVYDDIEQQERDFQDRYFDEDDY
ncbi:Coiled-coil domain-containing protein 97 [Rhizopus stolonifer]|uniref:Coiled-coil domain-containing protein 97 n=1 Tax=Rhizopus stolonifer TaxID=4846 RepID=A0A367J527_RHIST|nr:Coiled-coil domain-containing protein 97 [Rhizopus stolonifer]